MRTHRVESNLRRSHSRTVAFAAAAGLLTLVCVPVLADTYNWKGLSSGDGGGGGASDNWNTTDTNWIGFGPIWPGSGTDNDAVFGGTPGTVSVVGTIGVNDISFTTDGYLIQSNTLSLNGTTPTITVDPTFTATVSSSLTGTALTKSGTGTLVLSRAGGNGASPSGAINVNGGTLRLSGGMGFDAGYFTGSQQISVGTGATLNLAGDWTASTTNVISAAGGTINISAGSAADGLNYMNNVTLSNGAQITGNRFRIGNDSNGVFNITGSSASSISAGVIFVENDPAAGRTATFNVADVTSSAANDFTISGGIIDLAVPARPGTVLVKAGAGTMTLSAASSFVGGTRVDGGTLTASVGVLASAGNATAFGTGNITVNTGGTVTGSTFFTVGGGQTNTRTITLNGGTWDVNYAGTGGEYIRNISMTAGTLTRGVGAATTYIRVPNGGLNITTSAAAASSTITTGIDMTFNNMTFDVADGAAADDLVMGSFITQNTGAGSGAKSVTKTGAGTLVLNGTGTYTGGLLVSQGLVRLGTGTSAGNSAGTITLNNASTGANNTSVLIGAPAFVANPVSVTNNGTGISTLGTSDGAFVNAQFTGVVTLAKDATLQAGTSDRTTFTNQITGTGNLTITSPFAANRRIVFERTSGAANNFVGDIAVSASADLQLGAANSIGNRTLPDGTSIAFNTGSRLRIAPVGSGDGETMGALNSLTAGAGTVDMFTGTNFTLTVGGGDTSGSFSGTIINSAGTLNLAKTGSGTQILGGVSTYGGTTTLSAGTLLANNTTGSATGSGTVNVDGGILGGTGGIAGIVNVNSTGTLKPGNSPGTLAIGNTLTFNNGSTFMVELGGTDPGDGGTFYSQANMTNGAASVVLDSNVALAASLFGGFTPTLGDTFYILTRADAGSFGSSSFAGLSEGSILNIGGYQAQITYQANWTGSQAGSLPTGGNDVALTIVPEPSSLAMLAFGMISLWLFRRKR
jgi:fibronectin-binding autotransporter adhesin